jgi:hypothetical protein
MSIFGFYFVSGLMQEAGWPRRKGVFNSTAVIDTIILDQAIDQMIDWAAALGAAYPREALQIIAEVFRDRDWNGDERPDIRFFIEAAKRENESWRGTGVLAPHDIVQPARFAGDDAHRRAVEGIQKKGSSWKGPTMDVKDFKELRVPLEQWFLEGLLWGFGNPDAFGRWFQTQYEDQIWRVPVMREIGLAVDALPNDAQFLKDSEVILRKYEQEISPLPAIPAILMADAQALGRLVP